MNWKEIITEGDLKRSIEERIEIIADSLENEYSKIDQLGLFNGKAGIILFMCYYNKYKSSNRFNYLVEDYLSHALEYWESSDEISLEYATGFTGIFAVMQFLKEEFIELDDIPSEITDCIANYTKRQIIKERDVDFLLGATGNILVLSEIINDKFKIIELVKDLRGISIECNDYIKWDPSLILKHEDKVFNLSMAHGLSSIIIVLCNLQKRAYNEDTKLMIKKAGNFLLSAQNQPNQSFISVFPNFVKLDGGNSSADSRLSWCYGDLGHAMALLNCSEITQNEGMKNFAIDVFKFNAKRRGMKESYIVDAEFCHGTSGIAHIFNRAYNYIGDEELKLTSLFWFEKTIQEARYYNSCAGYKTLKNDGQMTDDYSLLEGISGIGLTLISAISDIEPKWDKFFLLS